MVQVRMERLVEKILGSSDKYKIEDIILNASAFVVGLMAIFSFIADSVQGVSTSLLFSGSILLVSMLIIFANRKKPGSKIWRLFLLLEFILVFLYIWYYWGGGFAHGFYLYFSMLLILVMVFRGYGRVLVFVFFTALLFLTLFLERMFPNLVNYMEFTQDVLNNIAITVFFLGLFLSILVSLVMYSYEQEQKKAQELNHHKDLIISIISHDLKSPLWSMNQLCDLLAKNYDTFSEAERLDYIKALEETSGKTYDLAENLLHWVRSGVSEPNCEVFNLRQIVSQNLDVLSSFIKRKNVNVKFNVAESHFVYADKRMLRTVFRNVLSNAIKFTKEKGEVCISSELKPNDIVILSIKDDGIGINSKYIPNLFDISSRYVRKGTCNEQGSGLGLKICKEFLVKNSGDIRVESEQGKGSTFYIEIPSCEKNVKGKC